MERSRQVMAVAVIAAACGCAATDRLTAQYHDARRSVGMDATAPPSQVMLVMQRRLAGLPDPLRPDATQQGLPGQVFLLGSDNRPAAADGDLTVVVSDDTPRPPGQPPMKTEKWQFGRDILTKLRQKDERFGECYVLFLPWPADWKDVSKVTVRAVYTPANGVTLHAQEVPIVLEVGTKELQERWEKLGAMKAAQPPAAPAPSIQLPPPNPVPVELRRP